MKKPEDNESQKPLKLMKLGSASEVYRIIPLGLTLEEARAWYVNRILIPRLRWALAALVVGSIMLSTLTELEQSLEQSLTTHMIVYDLLLLVSGFLFAYGINFLIQVTSHLSDRLWWARNALHRVRLSPRVFSISAFGSAALLIGYWYLPAPFNAAATTVSSSVEMQLVFLFAGGVIFVGAHFLNRRLKLIALVVVGKALGLYGMFLLLTPRTVYSFYPAYEQVYAGTALLFLMLILDFTIMPLWLYNYFGNTSANRLVGDKMSAA